MPVTAQTTTDGGVVSEVTGVGGVPSGVEVVDGGVWWERWWIHSEAGL